MQLCKEVYYFFAVNDTFKVEEPEFERMTSKQFLLVPFDHFSASWAGTLCALYVLFILFFLRPLQIFVGRPETAPIPRYSVEKYISPNS